jgi:selenocysteine lyase/cysteine desulfurase
LKNLARALSSWTLFPLVFSPVERLTGMLNRRGFLKHAGVGTALLGLPPSAGEQVFGEEPRPLPSDQLFAADQAQYWTELRRQWLLAPDRINLNCGSLGCSPLPVLRAVIDHLLSAESYREPGYPWFGYEEKPLIRQLRDKLAEFLHCGRDELAIVRNTTEGNNVVCNGLDLKAGEEAILTDQEHPGGRCCWEQKASRFGVKLKYVHLPRPPKSEDEIVERFREALTPSTRILVFSHITTVTGLVLPVKPICELARQRGILTHVDGAHAIGQIPLNLHELGCDFYATSPHKWLMAPKGTGLLYVREGLQERIWVNTASNEWRNHQLKAYRFSNIGTSNLSLIVGLATALDFVQKVGPERIYKRIHELAAKVRDRMAQYPQLFFGNASADQFYGGLVSLFPIKGDLKAVLDECAKRSIRVQGSPGRIRVATHIFTQTAELNTFFDAINGGVRG